MCPVAVVSSYRVVPALMNRKDGGATPIHNGKIVMNGMVGLS